MFVQPMTEVYEGHDHWRERPQQRPQREHRSGKETDEHAIFERRRSHPHRPAAGPESEQAIEFINDDEFVEVTPQSIRLRKKILKANQRVHRRIRIPGIRSVSAVGSGSISFLIAVKTTWNCESYLFSMACTWLRRSLCAIATLRLHERAHDGNVHLNRPLAVEHGGEHGHALLCEGVGKVPPASMRT